METGQGHPSRGSDGPQGSRQSSCPHCRRLFVPTSREEQNLQDAGEIRKQCKGCGKALVVTRNPDGSLDVILDFLRGADAPEAPSRRAGPKGAARGSGSPSLVDLPPLRPPSAAGSTARTPGGARPGGPETADLGAGQEEEEPGKPAETPRQARGRAASAEALGRLQECLAEIQGSQARGVEARLSEKSQQATQETIAACTRLENVAEKLEGAASRFFEQVQSKLFAPEGIRASLDAYHEWLLQRCGDEEKRLRIIERLPDLFDLVEIELAARRSAGDGPPALERQSAVVELVKLQIRIRAWQESVGLIRFPNPGDAFDATRHDADSVVETDDAAIVDTVKEVVRSGYRLGSDGPILRRARVVRWVKRGGK